MNLRVRCRPTLLNPRSRTLAVLLACAFAATGCGSTASTSTGPSPAKCGVTLSSLTAPLTATGANGAIQIGTAPECAWTASSQASWITGLTPASGQGNGELAFQVMPNPDATMRQADLVVNDQHTRVQQEAAPCRFELSSTAQTVDADGGGGTFRVVASAGCQWTARTDASWITLSPTEASGTGTVTFTVAANANDTRVGTVQVADNTFTVTQRGRPAPPTTACTFSGDPSTRSIAATGGSATFDITSTCAWNASVDASWLTIVAGRSGNGRGTLTVSAPPNTGASRSAQVSIGNDEVVTVTQAGVPNCTFTVSPGSQSAPGGGGNGTPISVTGPDLCGWSASSNASWLTITSGSTGTGNGSVAFTVAPNTSTERSGTLSVAGQSITVNQAAGTCGFTVAPTSQTATAAGGTGTPIAVTTTPECNWSARSNVGWLDITSNSSASGSASVTFAVAANGGTARSGTLTVANQTITVNQAGSGPCSFNVAPSTISAPAAGGAGTPIGVTATAGCNWTASANVSWLTVTSGASGNGNGTVAFTVGANSGAARSGTLTVASQTVTVNQIGTCTFTVAPPSQSAPSGGGAGTSLTVTSTAGCNWTAQSDVLWLSITSGASGNGNGTVAFNVAANTGSARSGTLTVAGHTVSVNQSGACTFTTAPQSQNAPAGGGTGTLIAVTAAAGCNWTATSNASWLSITSGSSGSGNGTVAFTVAANSGSARNGTLTVAGQTMTVNQSAGCSFSVSPTSQSIGALGGTGSAISVTTTSGCGWTAQSGVSWVTIVTGSSGNGSGSVTTLVLPNTGSARSGSVTVAGQSVTFNQASACVYVIAPTSQSFNETGGSGRVTVTALPGCAWSASSNASFLTISSGSSGNGLGAVDFSVAAMATGSSRSGTLTIAGQTFTVTQTRR